MRDGVSISICVWGVSWGSQTDSDSTLIRPHSVCVIGLAAKWTLGGRESFSYILLSGFDEGYWNMNAVDQRMRL